MLYYLADPTNPVFLYYRYKTADQTVVERRWMTQDQAREAQSKLDPKTTFWSTSKPKTAGNPTV